MLKLKNKMLMLLILVTLTTLNSCIEKNNVLKYYKKEFIVDDIFIGYKNKLNINIQKNDYNQYISVNLSHIKIHYVDSDTIKLTVMKTDDYDKDFYGENYFFKDFNLYIKKETYLEFINK